jgi:small conductance mechanosensitive channel
MKLTDTLLDFWTKYSPLILQYATKFVFALIVLWIGLRLIRKATHVLRLSLRKAGFADNIAPFLTSLGDISLKIILTLTIASILGIETASFVAALAAAGFAIGLALQGSLGNFAAGIVIIVFRPYKIGDWVEINEKFGKVEQIQIFNTTVVTPGNKTMIVPNGKVIDGIVTNYSEKGSIRLELNVMIPYEESYPKVEQLFHTVLSQNQYVLKDPAPILGIIEYNIHGLVIRLRPSIAPQNYWEATHSIYADIKIGLNQMGIKHPYPDGLILANIGE